MKRYIEVTASTYTQNSNSNVNNSDDNDEVVNEVGKKCYELLIEMNEKIHLLEEEASESKNVNENERDGAKEDESEENCSNKNHVIEKLVIGATTTKPNQQSQQQQIFNNNYNINNNVNNSIKPQGGYIAQLFTQLTLNNYLPPPLLPRGQLDISLYDFLYTIYQCLGWTIYTILFSINNGILMNLVAFIMPNFIVGILNVMFGKYHPLKRGKWYENEIEKYWLDTTMIVNDDKNHEEGGEYEQQQGSGGHQAATFGGSDNNTKQQHVIVGLSVRSLLDLYLTSKSQSSYPKDSEVIIVPPVTIPGMVDVMRYHGLTLVPIDLLSANDNGDANNNQSTKEEDDLYKCTSWGIDIPSIKSSISHKTVAIFIIHPFGTIITNPKTMYELRTIANENDIEIWEDCAQCYTGKSTHTSSNNGQLGYTGSKYANISFFSFGPIKTGTALGGGIAVLRGMPSTTSTASKDKTSSNSNGINNNSVEETVKSMKRIQGTMYKPQTNVSYFVKVIKCFFVHLISQSRLLCGLVNATVELVGLDYDMLVVSLLRGFAVSSTTSANKKYTKQNAAQSVTDSRQQVELIQQIRRRPCMALLALLRRRLLDSERTHESSMQRIKQCRAFTKRLLSDQRISINNNGITLPKNVDGSGMYGWVYPILVPDAQRSSKMLLKLGFDVPCGMTQLKPINGDGTKEDGGVDECPRARAVFDHILYLPVTSSNFTEEDQRKLINALVDISLPQPASTDEDENNDNQRQLVRKRQRRRPCILIRAIILFVGMFEWYFSILGAFHYLPVRVLFRLAVLIGPWIGVLLGMIFLLLLILCQYMGPVYLKSSTTFAKYCDMIFKSPFQQSETKSSNDEKFMQSATVLELASTKIPTVTSVDDITVENVNTDDDANESSQQVLLTGATGFIGSLLLRELLMHRHSLSIPGGVIVIVRSKRGKSARERIDRLLSQPMFDFLNEKERQSLVHVIEGNVTLPDCGMQSEQIKSLCQRNISHVFHCAAAVSFSQSLEDAAVSNITSSLQLHSMMKKLRRKDAKFVYISTAFVHGGKTGTQSEPLPEEMFSMYPYNPVELYKSMLGSQSYASAAMNELGFPNTYTFSKCICEQLLQASKEVETIIIRPSIVGPSVQEPFEGWAGEKPSTIVAAACLYLKFPYNMWCFGKEMVPFVPVDVVCRFVISKSFCSSDIRTGIESAYEGSEDEKKEMSPTDICVDKRTKSTIAAVAWDATSPDRSFSWITYAFSITHLGIVCGHVNRIVAYIGLLLSTRLFPWLNFRQDTFQRLHSMFVRAPLDIILNMYDKFPLKPRIYRDLRALSPVIDLPMLFFPFANQSFYFKSDLVAPEDFNGERYMFSCAVAAHRFIQMIEKQRKGHSRKLYPSNLRQYDNETIGTKTLDPSTSIVVAGATHIKPTSDLWWALTQPKGNLTIRFAGWILAKIFRYTSMEIEIDLASFESLSRAVSSSSSAPHVIIAPTHRSFYDFLIVSYICFSLPELGIEIPHIAAASDFSSIPIIGWLAKKSSAFFLKREGTKRDQQLKECLGRITKSKHNPAFIEVFIEGKRSRNRTFVKPRTGFLRCLAETAGSECIILPLTINYEGIPEEESLIKEVNGGFINRMSLSKLLNWMHRVFAGQVNIGRVYVSASKVLTLPNSSGKDINELAYRIQSLHQSKVMVSSYHIKAASLALELPEEVVIEALLELGCQIWPGRQKNDSLQVQDNQDFQWTAMLQVGHLFAPFIVTCHPIWSSWLSPSYKRLDAKVSSNEAVNALLSKLVQCFGRADDLVEEVITSLESKGFYTPEEQHVMQYLPTDAGVPLLLMQVAVKHKVAAGSISHANSNLYDKCQDVGSISPLSPSSSPRALQLDSSNAEAFGAWGYQDSYFVLNVKPDGSKQVTMKGSRYGISGKPLSGLASFVEEELHVAIDPKHSTFPSCESLENIPTTNLDSEGVAQIIAILGGDASRISSRPADRARRGTGHTQEDMYELRSGLLRFRVPDAVVWPQNEKDVQDLVNLASKNNWCLIPFGGGTNVSHSTHCPKRDIDPRPMISVDMKLMCRVLWVNEEDGLVHVEAGITGNELIQSMARLGFTIGHEPDSYEFSTLGGWIATKASGMKQNKYGNIEDIVREVSVVGTTGLMSHKHNTEKSSVGRTSTGVDLKSLMLGSEGCFGIIVSAVIKIWPLAELTSHESVLLPNFDVGMKYVKDLSKMRALKPASVRLLDNEQFRLGQALKYDTSRYESVRSLVSKKIGFHLGNFSDKSVVCATITFEGNPEEVKLQKKHVRELASVHGGILAGSKVGKAGYDLTFAIAYLRDFALNYNILGESFETFVPWSKLMEVVQATKQRIFSEHKSRALPGVPFICCRITQLYDDGACVYFYFCMQISGVVEPSHVFADIERSARQEILKNGGSLSHHHGLGKLRSPFVHQIYSQGYIDALIAMKKAIDPTNTFGARNGVFSTNMDDTNEKNKHNKSSS